MNRFEFCFKKIYISVDLVDGVGGDVSVEHTASVSYCDNGTRVQGHSSITSRTQNERHDEIGT